MPSTPRVHKHRTAMREAGYRLVQLRVPDTRSPAFAASIKRQMAVLRQRAPTEAELEFDRELDALVEETWADIEPAKVRADRL